MMDGERWQTIRINWYIKPKKWQGMFILAFQILILATIFVIECRSFLGIQTWKAIESATVLSTCCSISGLAAVADSVSVAGTIFVWLVNLAPQKECTVSMTELYKWAYPYFGKNFMLTMILLLKCIYEGNKGNALANMDAVPGCLAFIGGIIGSLYIVKMCWIFVFDSKGLKNITHSYLITKINADKEQKLGLFDFWQQHLLEDCYNCLENDHHKNLETILNESLTTGYKLAAFPEKCQNNMSPPSLYEVEKARIDFMVEQTQIWNAILSNRQPEEYKRLLSLDVQRMKNELEGEILPKFQIGKQMLWPQKLKKQTARGQNISGEVKVTLGRIVWFFIVLQKMEEDKYDQLFNQMYAVATKTCAGKEDAVEKVFHQLLLIAYLYFSIGKQTDRQADVVQLWDHLTTKFELTDTQFDELLALSAQMYAAVNSWTFEHYISKINQIASDGESDKNALRNKNISSLLHLVIEQQCNAQEERVLLGSEA